MSAFGAWRARRDAAGGWTVRGGPGALICADHLTASKSNDGGWMTAGGQELPLQGSISFTYAGQPYKLFFGLAPAEKDVSRGGDIVTDGTTWMIGDMEYGTLSVPGRSPNFTGKIESQQIITIEWDQQGVSFLVDGVRRGEKHAWGSTPPTGVRVVAALYNKGQSVSFVV